MKSILLFGAGKSATSLIRYLNQAALAENWEFTVADGDGALALSKVENAPRSKAVGVDVTNAGQRHSLIEKSTLVISLLPPHLHRLVAKDCVETGRHLFTASYLDEDMRNLEKDIKKNKLFFLCEMGLDPGIDHMSALQLVHGIHARGGRIQSFKSHCGGLVAPESDDNPWHYKISWNPRNIVMAGKAGATYRENGKSVHLSYGELFDPQRVVDVPGLGYLAWYPNRDSLSYLPLYGLEESSTFIRTTLRYPEFCFGWKNIIDLRLTDEEVQYQTDGMSLQQFFREHFKRYGFSEWAEKQLTSRFAQTKMLLEKLQELLEAEQEISEKDRAELQKFMMVDDQGSLMDINLDEVKTKAAATVAGQMHEANLSMKQLIYLGMDDADTLINRGNCSAMDVLQFALEKKLALKPGDKDMIVMMHELEYQIGGETHMLQSVLQVKGEDTRATAMAKTVGLPLGIAARLFLKGGIRKTGLHIPTDPEIYEPVLHELETQGICFAETTRKI